MPGSAVSGASSGLASSAEGSEKAALDEAEEDQGLHGSRTSRDGAEEAVFGVLFVLQNERPPESKLLVLLGFWIEWVQLLMFLLDPLWEWNVNFRNVFWRWLARFQLENPVTELSYELWVAVFYVICVFVCATIGISVYIGLSFKTGNLPYTVPIKVLRLFCAVFFNLFYVSVIAILLVALSCTTHNELAPAPFGYSPTEYIRQEGTLRAFDTVKCLSMTHAIHGVVAVVAVPVVAAIGFALALGDSTQDVLSGDFFGTADTLYKIRFFLCKTLVPFFMAFLPEHRKLLSLFFLVLYALPFYDQIVLQPFLTAEANHLNAACRGVHFWGAILLVCKMYNTGPDASHLLTDVALYASPFIFFLGMGANIVRLRLLSNLGYLYLNKTRFIAGQEPAAKPEAVADAMLNQKAKVKFWSVEDVEVVSRCIARTVRGHEERDHNTMIAAEAAVMAGMRQFPEESLLPVLYGCYVTHVLQDPGTGAIYFERARGMKPPLRLRFIIFVRDRQRKQKAQGEAAGEGAMDLVSYVEFQNSFALLLRGHRAALRSNRRFWRLLVKTETSFSALSEAFRSMDKAELKADRTYRSVLERYPKSTKVLRAYANFLEEVRNNPWSAKRYYDEAQKLEDAAEDEAANEGEEGGMKVNDKTDAVAVITTSGTIRVVNRCLVKMFGYRRQEDLIGKNVSMLMPPPYSTQHNTYLKRYMSTGDAHILTIPQKLEAKGKMGNVFNINLLVNKVESAGETTFMGVMQAVLDDGTAMAVLTMGGVIRSANPIFHDMFGFSNSQGGEAAGKNFKALLNGSVFGAQIDEIIAKVGVGGEEQERSFEGRSKKGTVFPISCLFQVDRSAAASGGGVIVKVTALNDNVGIITIDEIGSIEHVNTFITKIFGWKSEELSSMNISQLMPRPYSRFHAQYLANFRRTGVAKVLGDAKGRTVSGLHKDGRVFNLRLEVQEMKDEGQTKRLFSGRITLDASDILDRRCCKLKMSDDGDIITLTEGAEDLFGISVNDIVGFPIEELLRWPDGSTENILECLLAIPSHTRVPGAAVTARGKLIDGTSPPVVTMMVPIAGDSKNLTKVCVEAAPCDEPHSVELIIWSAPLLEGTMSIDAAGKIVDVSLGAAVLFGYRESELLSNDVTCLMKSKVARHHPTFLARFKDVASRRMVGTRRIVEAMHRDGTTFHAALEISDADVARGRADDTGAAFTARVVMTLEECSVLPKVVTSDPTGDDGRDAAKASAHLKFRQNPEIPAHRASSRGGSSRSGSQRSNSQIGSVRGGRGSEGIPHHGATGIGYGSAPAAPGAPQVVISEVHAASVTATWESFAESMADTGKVVMRRFFELDPLSLQRFSFKDAPAEGLAADPRFEAHALILMKGLDSIITNLGTPDSLLDIIDGVGASHAAREVDHDSMDAMADAVSDTFAEMLGASYSADRREAWKAVSSAVMERIKYRLGKPRVFPAPVQPHESLLGQPIMEANESCGPVERLGGLRTPASVLAAPSAPAAPHPLPKHPTGAKCPFGFDAAVPGPGPAAPASPQKPSPLDHVAAITAGIRPPPGCPAHVPDAAIAAAVASAPASVGTAGSSDAKEAEALAMGFDAELVARARKGHCVFFADDDDEAAKEPSEWVGPRPAAQQRMGGCLFADAMGRPVGKLPPRYERMMHQQRLKEQYAEHKQKEAEAKEAAAAARAEVDAARRARSFLGRLSGSSAKTVTPAAPSMAVSESPVRVPPALEEMPEGLQHAPAAARVGQAGPVTESVYDEPQKPRGVLRTSEGKHAQPDKKASILSNGLSNGHSEQAVVKKHVELERQNSDDVDPERDSPEALAKSFAHKTTDIVLAENDAEMEAGGPEEDVSELKDAEDLKMKRDAEFQRARRFKQVLKLLNNLQMRKALQMLTTRTRHLLVLLGTAYLACFVVMEVQLVAIPRKFVRLVLAGNMLKYSQRGAILSGVTAALMQPQPVNFSASVLDSHAQLLERANELDELLHGIYLGFEDELQFPGPELAAAIGDVRLRQTSWVGGREPWPVEGNITNTTASLWNLARTFNSKMRVVGASTSVSAAQLTLGAVNDVYRERRFILLNGPYVLYDALTQVLALEKVDAKTYMEATIQAQTITAAVLGITFIFSFLAFKYLLDRVARARLQLFGVFLCIPRPVVMKLATKSTKLAIEEDGEEEDDDDDDDNDWAQRQALALAKLEHNAEAEEEADAATQRMGKKAPNKVAMNQIAPIGASGDGMIKIKTKARKMNTSGSSSYIYLVPIILWGAVGVTAFAISAQTLGNIADVLGDLVYSNIEAAMGTRLRLFAVQLMIAAAAQPPLPAVVASARAALNAEAKALLKVHTGLIYGDAANDLKGSLYISEERQNLLFGFGCLRTLKPCRAVSDPYYPATNYGLDAMVKQVVEQAELLSNDPLAQLTVQNERFSFLWDVGPTDLFDAQTTSVKLYEKESIEPAAVAQWLQIAVLPFLFAGKIIFLIKFFKPWVQRTMHETKRVAELLAQLPRELNVEALIIEFMGNKADPKIAAALAAASKKKREIPRTKRAD